MPAHTVATRRMWPFAAALLLLVPAGIHSLMAQESAESAQSASSSTAADKTAASSTPTPLKVGEYTLIGSGSFGYRFVNLEGNHAKYDQLLNLQEGFRVFSVDFSL